MKYAVPITSAAVGGGYNYVATRSMGKIAKSHFKKRGRFTAELRTLLSRRNTYDLVFPAAALHVANLDGEFSPDERDLYRSMLSRMRFEEHAQEDFKKLTDSETDLVQAAAGIEDPDLRRRFLEVLVLMAVCDGRLAREERAFLANIAERLELPLDPDEVEKRARDYQATDRRSIARRATSSVKDTATVTRGKVRDSLGKVRGRRTLDCPGCGERVSAKHAFCPDCGQAVADMSG